MSLYRDLISRMAIDDEFAVHARTNPDEVARIYRLTPEETEKFRRLTEARPGTGPTALGARLSKSGLGGGALGAVFWGGDNPLAGVPVQPEPATMDIRADTWTPGPVPPPEPGIAPVPDLVPGPVPATESTPVDEAESTAVLYGVAGVTAGAVIGAAAASLLPSPRTPGGRAADPR
ncbi:hypothetical protein [Longispora albida]|uniref:hypothetical protein n=1 Tax=Longispora albida TaxID=203523 RepID=UPI0003A52A05|nr:hypothetical protein [Longispora albida]